MRELRRFERSAVVSFISHRHYISINRNDMVAMYYKFLRLQTGCSKIPSLSGGKDNLRRDRTNRDANLLRGEKARVTNVIFHFRLCIAFERGSAAECMNAHIRIREHFILK